MPLLCCYFVLLLSVYEIGVVAEGGEVEMGVVDSFQNEVMLLLLFEFLGSFVDDSDLFFQFEVGCKTISILELLFLL